MPNKTISIIGAGHLGSAFIRGLIKTGQAPDIVVSNSNFESSKRLASELNITAAQTNKNAVEVADVLILAVKPQILKKLCQEIALTVKEKRPLIISLAAVVSTEMIAQWLNALDLGIVRVMTNTPMEFCKGMAALYSNAWVTKQQLVLTTSLFNSVGKAFWVDKEPMLDTLTAAIGCSPAYVFLFMEALQNAALSRGIPEEFARTIAIEIILGSAELAKNSPHSFTELREGVATPNGVTAYSLNELSINTFLERFKAVYKAAEDRIEEIKTASDFF